jgi:hypothetical protein
MIIAKIRYNLDIMEHFVIGYRDPLFGIIVFVLLVAMISLATYVLGRMKRAEILRELDTDQSDWMAYYSELWLFQKTNKSKVLYLPSPAEIEWRCHELRWLESCGFCRAFIVNVMEYDNPEFERIVRMVRRHGVEETYRRCKEFLFPTEYG